MIRALRLRLTLVCTCATVLVLAVMALVMLRYSERQIHSQAHQAFLSNVNSICYNLRNRTVVDNAWVARTEASDSLFLYIESGDGPLLYTRHSEHREMLAAVALREAQAQGFLRWQPPQGSLDTDLVLVDVNWESLPYRAAVCTVPMPGDAYLEVTILKSTGDELAQVIRLRLVFGASVAAAALCLFLFAWRFTIWASRPIEENHRRQTEFVAAASHELRAPLAVVQASAGTLHQATAEQVRSLADAIGGECRRMAALLQDLLFLAKADSGRWSASMEEIEPDTLLLGVGERCEVLARRRGIRLEIELPEEAPLCRCDPARMEQVLFILIDNALSFTPSGGTVTLRTGAQGRWVWFSVSDTGPGIPEGQMERIFDRFYQGDAARTDREHYGLGLSIAREIAALHRGSLSAENRPQGGAVFTCSIPRGEGGRHIRPLQ